MPDYLQTNEVVSARRGMTEALPKAGFLPVVSGNVTLPLKKK